MVSPTSRAATIKKDLNPFRRPKEYNPDPGQYDGHLTPFGSDVKKFTMGGKYKWKADQNPALGTYDVDTGYNLTQYNNRSATIRKEVSPFRRPKDSNPDPGQYDGHLTPFGSDVKKFTMGGKYKWKAD